MLNSIIDLVRQHSGSLQSADIPAGRQEEAVTAASTSILDGLRSVLSGGGVTNVMQLFNSGSGSITSSPAFEAISRQFTHNFSSTFGMGTQAASSLGASFLPGVVTQLVARANDPSDSSFDMQGLFNELSEGKTSGMNISSIFAKVKSGLDRDGDGDVDLQDLKSVFTNSGFVDKIKNVFK